MDTKGGKVDTMGEPDEPLDCHASGHSAWCGTQPKDLQLWHCSRYVDDDVVIYRRGTTDVTGFSDSEFSQMLKRKQRGIIRVP